MKTALPSPRRGRCRDLVERGAYGAAPAPRRLRLVLGDDLRPDEQHHHERRRRAIQDSGAARVSTPRSIRSPGSRCSRMNQSALVYQAPTSTREHQAARERQRDAPAGPSSARSSPSRRTRRRTRSRAASARARGCRCPGSRATTGSGRRPAARRGTRAARRSGAAAPTQPARPPGSLPYSHSARSIWTRAKHDGERPQPHLHRDRRREEEREDELLARVVDAARRSPSASATAAPRAATASSRGVAEGAVAAVICRESPTSATPRSSRVEHHPLGLVARALDQLAHLVLRLPPRAEDSPETTSESVVSGRPTPTRTRQNSRRPGRA